MNTPFDVLLEDTQTGARRWASTYFDKGGFDAYWWAEGNGSCDCNRALVFEPDGDLGGDCNDTGRYRVVETRGEMRHYSLDDFNK